MQRRAILANACSAAVTAAEAGYRISRPIIEMRSTRVVAIDVPAAEVVRSAAPGCSARARFFTTVDGHANNSHSAAAGEPTVTDLAGGVWTLRQAIDGADLVVMVASSQTSDEASGTARALGEMCDDLHVMTAGVVLGHPSMTREVVSALRPHTRMLLVSDDHTDLADVLTSLRA